MSHIPDDRFLDKDFFAVQKLRRKQVGTGVAQQCLFYAVSDFISHGTLNTYSIIRWSARGYARFQTGIHARAIHAVKQGLHKPFDI